MQQKNFELLLDSFAKLREKRDARLIILGEGPRRKDLEKLAIDLGIEKYVQMPGFVDNPYAYMARSVMLVMSSHFEALPAVLIEALHVGTQVVSTDCPSGPYEILENGKYGELVPVNDADALADGMIKALDNKTFKPNPDACNRYIDRHVAPQYLEVLIGPDFAAH